MKRLCAIALALSILLCGCEGGFLRALHQRLAPNPNGDWVIFVYLCGSDLESVDGSGSLDLAEMQEVRYDGSLTFVVQTGGASEWGNSRVNAEQLGVWQIDGDGMQSVATFPSASMGDAATLAQFLTFCAEHYPDADHRGLVLWNHGGGSVDGVCFDERYDDDSLLLPELQTALEDGGMTYDFIGFDACLMATAETAAVCQPYTDYLIASQETEAGLGWAYRELGDAICVERQTMPALGQTICDDYLAACGWMGEAEQATMSVLDLQRLPLLSTALDTLASALADADAQTFGEAAQACAQARFFGDEPSEDTNMADLGGILKELSPLLPEAADVTAALSELVVYQATGSACRDAGGLSIYYPLSPDDVQEVQDAAELALCPGWAALVRRLGVGASGDSAVGLCELYFDDDGCLTLRLDPDTLEALKTVSLDLYRETDDGSAYLGRGDAVVIDRETGLVRDDFDGTWRGEPLPAGYYDCRFCVIDRYDAETTTNFARFYVDEDGEVWY